MKKRHTNRIKHTFILTVFVVGLLIANYLLGTQNIIDAHKENFRGGICEACQTCMFRMKLACDKYYGFDFYTLIFSSAILTFILGLFSSLFQKSQKHSFLTVILGTIGFIILIEIIVHFGSIPVLYTEFMERRQSLSYEFLLFNWRTQHIGLVLLFTTVVGLIGMVTGLAIRYITRRRDLN